MAHCSGGKKSSRRALAHGHFPDLVEPIILRRQRDQFRLQTIIDRQVLTAILALSYDLRHQHDSRFNLLLFLVVHLILRVNLGGNRTDRRNLETPAGLRVMRSFGLGSKAGFGHWKTRLSTRKSSQ
jgi:hypothetical protein